jgi:hypothetical protein
MLNVVLTDWIPVNWVKGRSVAGTATIHEGYHLSLISMKNAYPNRIPFLAVNTLVHELLHVFGGDIFVRPTGLLRGKDREAMVEWQATRLWLFDDVTGIKESARTYVTRLPQGVGSENREGRLPY